MDKVTTCYSRREVERDINFRGRCVLISIRDPGSPPVHIPKQSGLVEALELQFHDAEPTSSMTLPAGKRLCRGRRLHRLGIIFDPLAVG